MGNRSRYVALTAAGAAAVAVARRRARLRRAVEDLTDGVAAPHEDVPPGEQESIDEAHAPGHRHLSRPESDAARASWRERRRPWTRAAYRIWEPFHPN